MSKSKIEWTDETWNPVTGCSKVSQGCKNCYAERVWSRMSAPGMPYHGRKFTDIEMHDDRVTKPLHWEKPRRVFVNSMSDLFHEHVTDSFIRAVFGVMLLTPHHTFQVLTKRPGRMYRWFKSQEKRPVKYGYDDPMFQAVASRFPNGYPDHDWPPKNVWLGVSVEDQATANERIPILLETPAAVRWLSVEPMIGPVDLTRIERAGDEWTFIDNTLDGFRATKCGGSYRNKIDWVVCGGESGPKARPMETDWGMDLMQQCKAAGVPFFMKQMSQANWFRFKDDSLFPESLKVREYPE